MPENRWQPTEVTEEQAPRWGCVKHVKARPLLSGGTLFAVITLTIVVIVAVSTSTTRAAEGVGNQVLPWGPADCFVKQSYDFSQVVIQKDVEFGQATNPFTDENDTLVMDIYFPPISDRREARPVAVLVHGGSFTYGSKTSDGVPRWATVLASRGYIAISIEYRMVPLTQVKALRTPDPVVQMAQEDARAAVRFLRSKAKAWRADTGRIAVGGDSAGAITALYYGYMTNASEGLSGTPEFPSGINAVMSISGSMKGEAFCARLDADLNPSGCLISCPPAPDRTSEMSAGGVPLVMLHGTDDQIIPYVNGLEAARRANETGIRNTFITIPGAGHVPMDEALDTESGYLNEWLTFLSGALNLADTDCPSSAESTLIM